MRRITRRTALKDFSFVAGLSLFLPRGWAQDVLPVRRRQAAAAAGGGQNATDNFNRADNADLGANWTPVTDSLKISGNTAIAANTGTDATERYSAITWTANQSSEAKIACAVSDPGVGYGVGVRYSSVANTGYRLVINGDGEWELGRVVAGAFTSMATGTATFSSGAVLKLSAIGTTITSTYNGSQIDSRTDVTIASGFVAIAYSSSITPGTIDDWVGNDGL